MKTGRNSNGTYRFWPSWASPSVTQPQAIESWWEVFMTIRGHVHNRVVVLDPPATLPEGTAVRVEPLTVPAEAGCFAAVERQAAFDPAALEAMKKDLTAEQFEALRTIASQGGPD